MTDDLRERFERDGHVVVRGLVGLDDLAGLIAAVEVARREAGPREDGRGAFALRNLAARCAAVRELMRGEAMMAMLARLCGTRPHPARSILFDKTADANWAVPWHQDAFVAVRERRDDLPGWRGWSVKDGVVNVVPPPELAARLLLVRLHLDDCGTDNGALRVLPGTHRGGLLGGPELRRAAETVAPVTLDCAAGDAIVMRPLLAHASSPSVAPSHRRVLQLEYAAFELPPPLAWAE